MAARQRAEATYVRTHRQENRARHYGAAGPSTMTPPPDLNPVHVKKYLDLWQLSKTFPTPTGPSIVVQGFDLAVSQGEFVTLIGHSGCGKSTVLSMIAGLTPATSGTII